MIRRLYFIFFCFIFLFACKSKTPAEHIEQETSNLTNRDSIAQILKEIHAAEKAKQLDIIFKNKVKTAGFNGCVLIAQRGQIIYKNAFGFKNIKTKAPLTTSSAFQLASASKTLTAAAILLLKDQDKLKLTDDVQKYFPEFPYQNISINLLLSHRSGLSNYVYFCEPYCDANNCYNGKVFDNNSALQIMIHTKPSPYAAPNKKFEYCNTNYALLALIVEKISGKSFADFMEQNIFKPLAMNDTWIHNPRTDSQHKNKTIGHTAAGKFEDETYADDVVGDKGVYSTIEDLFKWDRALYSEKLLKKETIAEAFTGYSNEHKGKRNYGYGWRLIDNGKGDKIIYHNGWWHGYATLFYRKPSTESCVIILSNKYNGNIYQIKDILTVLDKNTTGIDVEHEE
jgi:CubicO group peptidase (beta-lactamase class C family)